MRYRRIALAFGAVVIVLAAEWLWLRSGQDALEDPASPFLEAQASIGGGAFSLTDHNGKPVSDAILQDRLSLLVFGYSYCPDVCPTMLARVAEALDLLGEPGEEIQPLFVTIDPKRDTPEALAAYVPAFHPRLIGLTGTPDQVAEIAANYRVYRAKVGDGKSDFLMDHSAFLYLVGPDRKLLAYLQASPGSSSACPGESRSDSSMAVDWPDCRW